MFPISDSIQAGKFPFINYSLIILTIAVFILQITTPDQQTFINSYALIPANVSFIHIKTLLPFITAIFLHGGLLHIITNMWFLFVFGDNVEAAFGKISYLLLYVAAGVIGNITQYILMPSSQIPMLGASGAIAGVLCAYFILFPYAKIKTLFFIFFLVTFVNIPATLMLGYWFVLQILSGATSLPGGTNTGGVAFFAHIGGFITGILFAKILNTNELENIGYE